MGLVPTPELGRRPLLVGGLATAGVLLLPTGLAAQGARLVPTPAQTEGPFYPVALPADIDNDLVVLRGSEARAAGIVTHVSGRVLDSAGAAIPGAVVEIWQCDAHGRYLHPADTGAGRPRDLAFQGYGRTSAAADGAYRFRTIRPVAYPGRTPHIHFAVQTPGRGSLITQMYVAGEPLNQRDFVFLGIRDRRQRDSVLVRLEPANGVEPGALAGTFDIVVG